MSTEQDALDAWASLAGRHYQRLALISTKDRYIANAWEAARSAARQRGELASGPAVTGRARDEYERMTAEAREAHGVALKASVAARVAAFRAGHDHSASSVGEHMDGSRYCAGCLAELP